jgi:hypothetical protein
MYGETKMQQRQHVTSGLKGSTNKGRMEVK